MSRGGATRFAKGQSGNPKGRPRKAQSQKSAFDVVIDRTFTVTQNGVERELTVDEALQLRTYQDALAGNRAARRDVLKMIAKREKWLSARQQAKRSSVEMKRAHEGRTADEALLVLGIASLEPSANLRGDEQTHLKLEPWVVELGLKRGNRKCFDDADIAEVKRCTRAPNKIDWP